MRRVRNALRRDDRTLKTRLTLVDWSRRSNRFDSLRKRRAGPFWLRRVWQALAVFSRGPEARAKCPHTMRARRRHRTLIGFSDDTVSAIRVWMSIGMDEDSPTASRASNSTTRTNSVPVADGGDFFQHHGVLTAYDMQRGAGARGFDPDVVDARWLFAPTDPSGNGLERAMSERHRLGRTARRAFLADQAALISSQKRLPESSTPNHRGLRAFARCRRPRGGIATILGSRKTSAPVRRAALPPISASWASRIDPRQARQADQRKFDVVRQHPSHTERILRRIGCFSPLTEMAASHHETAGRRRLSPLPGSGTLTKGARVVCVADVCNALQMSRPYRAGLATERVLEVMRRDAAPRSILIVSWH